MMRTAVTREHAPPRIVAQRARWSALAVVVAAALLARATFAQPTPRHPAEPRAPTLQELGTAWSDGQGVVGCRPATDPEDWAATPGEQKCEWPRVSRGPAVGRVTGYRASNGLLGGIVWERAVPDSAAAFRLGDSLDVALRARGVRGYDCGKRGNWFWQNNDLRVLYFIGVPNQDGYVMVGVGAVLPIVDVQASWRVSCPNVPDPPPWRPPAGVRVSARPAGPGRLPGPATASTE